MVYLFAICCYFVGQRVVFIFCRPGIARMFAQFTLKLLVSDKMFLIDE